MSIQYWLCYEALKKKMLTTKRMLVWRLRGEVIWADPFASRGITTSCPSSFSPSTPKMRVPCHNLRLSHSDTVALTLDCTRVLYLRKLVDEWSWSETKELLGRKKYGYCCRGDLRSACKDLHASISKHNRHGRDWRGTLMPFKTRQKLKNKKWVLTKSWVWQDRIFPL